MLFAHVARIAKVSDRTQEFIKDFTLFIKPCYHIVSSVKKVQKAKIQRLQGQKLAE